MRKLNKITFLKIIALVFTLSLSSCVSNSGGGKSKLLSGDENVTSGGDLIPGTGSGGSFGAPGEGGLGSSNPEDFAPKVELRHIVDPFDGSFKSKVSIPKNFSGILFIAGLNLASVKEAGKLVKVRFKFGRSLNVVEANAIIQPAEGFGITPATKVDVLMIDLGNTKIFESMRLSYDLFDYNDYRTAGVESKDIVYDPRDSGLFCRGLNIEYDPTFERTATNTKCDAAGEVCNYAYAKVRDTGLYYDKVINSTTYSVYEVPTLMQIDYSGTGYTNDTEARSAKKCLPDSTDMSFFKTVVNNTTLLGGLLPNVTALTLNNTNYTYKGPYFSSGVSDWQISGGAIYSKVDATTEASGIYQENTNGADYKSFLFPRAGKLDLQAGVGHIAASTPFADPRSLTSLLSSGDTEWVEGCNLRVQHYDSFSNETISSCNVTAEIEVVHFPSGGGEEIIATSRDLKLQLIRPFESDDAAVGTDVLESSLKTCENSQACGANSCCFNNRCWSKDIVSQCLEEIGASGNKRTGEACSSDYECASLCCDASVGSCKPHVNDQNEKSLCSKGLGQTCVAKEFCKQETVFEFFLIKTTNGCAYQKLPRSVHGDCINGTCQAPEQPVQPADFDNPDCTNALVKPPENF